MEIEINGIKYQKKPQTNLEPKRYSKSFSMLYGMAMMFGVVGTSRQRETPKVNLIKEFELIQFKKSLLSKKDRDWVVFTFNRNYTVVS